MGIHAPGWKTVPDLIEEWLQHRRNATAHDEDVGIQQVDDVSQPRQSANRPSREGFRAQADLPRHKPSPLLHWSPTTMSSVSEIENGGMPREFGRQLRARPCADRWYRRPAFRCIRSFRMRRLGRDSRCSRARLRPPIQSCRDRSCCRRRCRFRCQFRSWRRKRNESRAPRPSEFPRGRRHWRRCRL